MFVGFCAKMPKLIAVVFLSESPKNFSFRETFYLFRFECFVEMQNNANKRALLGFQKAYKLLHCSIVRLLS